MRIQMLGYMVMGFFIVSVSSCATVPSKNAKLLHEYQGQVAAYHDMKQSAMRRYNAAHTRRKLAERRIQKAREKIERIQEQNRQKPSSPPPPPECRMVQESGAAPLPEVFEYLIDTHQAVWVEAHGVQPGRKAREKAILEALRREVAATVTMESVCVTDSQNGSRCSERSAVTYPEDIIVLDVIDITTPTKSSCRSYTLTIIFPKRPNLYLK